MKFFCGDWFLVELGVGVAGGLSYGPASATYRRLGVQTSRWQFTISTY
jgi:hypothetical protein